MSQMNAIPTSDEQRFAAFLQAQQRTLLKVAYVYCRDPEDRRDLVQEMAVQLWRSMDRFEGRAAPATWAYRVALNVAISHHRRTRRHRGALPLDAALHVADQAFAERSVQSRQLYSFIDTLDGMNRALVLLYLEGFDHAEIADSLGVSPAAVAMRLNRLKAKLQTELAPAQEPSHDP